jgi:hypothetical protein
VTDWIGLLAAAKPLLEDFLFAAAIVSVAANLCQDFQFWSRTD